MESPKTYLTVLHSKPGVKLPENTNLNLNFPKEFNSSILINELKQKFGDQYGVVGLEFRVRLEASNVDEAIERSVRMSDGVSSFVTLVTGVGIFIPNPVLCYEITPGKKELDFLQFYDDVPLSEPSRNQLIPNDLIRTLDIYHNLSEREGGRLGRAARWYRFGTASKDPFERFSSYWIGLEALNPLLEEKLTIKDVSVRCDKCGHKWPPPTTEGIRQFFTDYVADGANKYESMRKLRNAIIHSFEPLSSITLQTDTLAKEAGNALIDAISFLMNLQPPIKGHERTLTNAVPFRVALKGHIALDKPEDLKEDPRFDSTGHVVIKVERSPEGDSSVTITSNWKATILGKSQLVFDTMRVYGEGTGKLRVHDFKKN